ncbi:DUF2336 domain-containing protein [Stappia sp. ES.058]|uniref:DUF2336 domain-containing protein n=1 Tax=Stappia sp. ES.058 TaxID=1881061 RepID=UPI000879A2F7|nr:DUF2336 domain-containing protein [Stappia sp. ES.058]SDU34345.1 Uncharacterized conserved protein, DUF2336 family [Stappia sp. ES.058]
MLRDLLELARNPSTKARGQLLQRVADLFLDRVGYHSAEELELFCEIILKLLDGSEIEERARLSKRMAPWNDTPGKIAYRLASDEILVAAPMLELSPSLSEHDLLKLARRMPQSHLVALAKRADMPCRLSDALVERGTPKVWREMAGNRSSTFSEWALRALAKRSFSDALLREKMGARIDLTPLICEWLIPHVNASTRVRLEAIMSGTDPRELTTPDTVRQDMRRRLNIFLETTDIKDLEKLVREGEYRLGTIVLVLLAEGRTHDAFELLARETRHPVKAVQRAVFQAGIDELINLCHTASLSVQVFLALAHLRCKHLRIPESQAVRWLDAFRRTAPAPPPQAEPRGPRKDGP